METSRPLVTDAKDIRYIDHASCAKTVLLLAADILAEGTGKPAVFWDLGQLGESLLATSAQFQAL